MRVPLDPWEIEWVYAVGIRRDNANRHKSDAAHYKKELMEDNMRASIAAAAAECAVAKATCCYWSASVWDSGQHSEYRGLPDVMPNIEVRRVRDPDKGLIVRKREIGKGRIIFVAYPHPPKFDVVDVLGWSTAEYAWEHGEPTHFDPQTTRRLSQDLLKTVEELDVQELVYA